VVDPAPPKVGGALERTGAAIAPLLLYPSRWIYRRVESVEFIDDIWVRRRVSVDFELPPFARNAAYRGQGNSAIFLAPLALLAKRDLRHFDVRDENGRPLPMLTRDQNVRVGGVALVSQAIAVLEREHKRSLEPEIALDLSGIAATAQPERAMVDQLFEPRGAARINRELLSRDPAFKGLVGSLLENFLVLVPVRLGWRRVIKYAYDEPLPRSHESRRRRLAVAFGWQPYAANWSAPSVGVARSFHLEVEAPNDLEITAATLICSDSRGSQYRADDGPSGHRSHLHLQGVPQDAVGNASVGLRVRRPGLLRASLILGALTSAVVTAGAVRIPSLESDPASAVTLLAVLPAILAAYLARPGEHELASTLLRGVRFLIASIGLVAALSAVTLLAGFSNNHERLLWLVYAAIGWLATAGLAASYFLPPAGDAS
jgi:hypothetical protein